MKPKPLIMVIEDDADISDVLVMMLEASGYDTVLASNGREGLDQLGKAETLPDVILLDLMMPVMDGWEFRIAQKSDPALAHVPVVLVSAHVEVRSMAAKMEVAAWLRKPIDFRELLKVLERLDAAALEPARARA